MALPRRASKATTSDGSGTAAPLAAAASCGSAHANPHAPASERQLEPRRQLQPLRHLRHLRARRRVAELLARGIQAHLPDVLIDIRARDERDSRRDAAPLKQAGDADLLDTSELDVEQAISAAIELVEARIKLVPDRHN